MKTSLHIVIHKTFRLVKIISFSLFSFFFLLLFTSFSSFAQSFTLQWAQTVNPSASSDQTRAITADASGIYVAGGDGTGKWRIEKRDLTTGALIAGFGTGGVVTSNSSGGVAYAITADASGIYVAGSDGSPGNPQWRIEKRNLTNGGLIAGFGTGGVITSNFSSLNDVVNAITADASGIYVAGLDGSGSFGWRIEKRDLTTGALIAGFGTGGVVTSDPSGSTDEPYAITADASGIYIAGYDFSPGMAQWRIEKRDLTTGALMAGFGTGGVVTNNPSANTDFAYAIAADASAIYVAGHDGILGFINTEWRIEKRDLTTGALMAGFGTNGVVTSNFSGAGEVSNAITIDASGIYMAGIDGTGGGQWRIEKRDLVTGALLCTYTNNPSASSDEARAITADANGIYVAGYDYSPGNDQWRIEKYDLCNGALPVELVSFTSQWLTNEQEKALLTWQTATEINNNYFTLERSVDGVNFSSIATVNGAGNSSSILNYQYIDNTLPQKTKTDVFYYRLKQTDFDGQYSYSNIEVLTRGSITLIGPSPNPIGDELNFTLVSAIEGEINIAILSMLGQLVKKETYEVHKGIQQIKMSLTTLSAGSYLLHIRTTDGTERISKKFVMK